MNKKLTAKDIQKIKKDPKPFIEETWELREHLEKIIISLQNATMMTQIPGPSLRTKIDNIIDNVRQKYPRL